jgi:hypothetical protein
MKSNFWLFPFLVMLLSTAVNAAPISLTGTYRYGESTLSIVQSAPDQIQFDLLAAWRQGRGEGQLNTGTACGKLKLDGMKAIYKNSTYGDCEIDMSFLPGKANLVQNGSSDACGFGFNVEATGLYRKVSSKPPQLDPCSEK